MAKKRKFKLTFNSDDGLLQNMRKRHSNDARSGICSIKHSNLKWFRFMGIWCVLELIFAYFVFCTPICDGFVLLLFENKFVTHFK